MGPAEKSWRRSPTRRRAVQALAGFCAASPAAQLDPLRDHARVKALAELESSFDFEAVAHAKVPRAAFNYTAYGTESEFTLRRNREAFDWVKLVPDAIGGGEVRTSTELLGMSLAYPILISPTAAQAALHPEGEAAMHQGATAANTVMIVSNVSSFPISRIAAAAAGPLWFQLYPKREPEDNRAVLEEAQAAGCKAIVVTVDQQAAYFERPLHDRHLGSGGPPRRSRGAPANPYRVDESRMWYHWKLFDQIRPYIKVPVVIKGILTAEDARLAIEHGLDAVYVSNHGGRALDYSPSTIEVLPEIADAVGGRAPVLFDSGIRRGSDILKALALGASAVCLGRVPRWGLAAYGSQGVQRVLEILQAELAQSMASTGRRSIGAISRSLVTTDFP